MRLPADRICSALVLAILACPPSDSPPAADTVAPFAGGESRPAPPASEPRPAEHLAVPVPRSVPALDTLIAGLASLPGELTDHWDFVGDHRTFAAILALSDSNLTLADTAVVRLVDCMGRTDPSAVTFQGRPVPVGIVCHRVMNWFAYHEEAGPDGGLVSDWAGHVTLDADPKALRAAQRAWRIVVRQRTYSFL